MGDDRKKNAIEGMSEYRDKAWVYWQAVAAAIHELNARFTTGSDARPAPWLQAG